MKIKKEHRNWIDAASYEEMLRRLRFSPAGDPLFIGDTGKYFSEVMKEKKEKVGQTEVVEISKKVGWNR